MTQHSSEVRPQFYTDVEQWAEVVTLQCISTEPRASRPETLYVLDVDDTIVDSNLRWYQDYVLMTEQHGIDRQRVVSLQEFKRLGPRVCFARLGILDDYNHYKELLMHDIAFHAEMEALGAANTVLADFKHSGYLPGAYLSTRPAVLGEVTKQNLDELNYADVPLLVRPERYDYGATIGFKIEALSTLRERFDATALGHLSVMYIDDFAGVVDGVKGLGRPGLDAILFQGEDFWTRLVDELQ